MELTNTKMTNENNSKKHLIFLILLGLAIGALFVATITLKKNAEAITTDPVQYSINHDFYDSCSCMNKAGGIITFTKQLNEVTENRSG